MFRKSCRMRCARNRHTKRLSWKAGTSPNKQSISANRAYYNCYNAQPWSALQIVFRAARRSNGEVKYAALFESCGCAGRDWKEFLHARVGIGNEWELQRGDFA